MMFKRLVSYMVTIDTEFLEKCITQVEKSFRILESLTQDDELYEITRNSLVKSFEMTLEQAGNLLRKKLLPYFPSKQALDKLTFKNLFRSAFQYSLLSEDEVNRWMLYRDNRNDTTHNYGEEFALYTLTLISDFINDSKRLIEVLHAD